MARHKYPPKGYKADEYPLPHRDWIGFSLRGYQSQAKNATHIPLFRSTEGIVAPESIEVNPKNPLFSEEGGLTCAGNSIIPKCNVTLHLNISKAALAVDPYVIFKVKIMPIYVAFLDNITASDVETTVTVGDLLELTTGSGNKKTVPIYTGTKLDNPTNHPLNGVGITEVYNTDWSLTTDATVEEINFDPTTFFQAINHYTNKGMLRSSIGKIKTIVLGGKNNQTAKTFHSGNFTHPKVRRMNPYTYCGILIWVEPETLWNTWGNPSGTGHDLTDIAHIHVNGQIVFDEWNPEFDQSAY